MLFVIFTYNRPYMLAGLLSELFGNGEVLIIDDGTKVDMPGIYSDQTLIRTVHEGKQGFWKKWLLARQIALATGHDYFCFLPDDVHDIDLKALEEIKAQGWHDRLFAMTLCNTGERYRWGKWRAIQDDFELSGRTWQQCDYVDGCFITNRLTLESFDIDPVPAEWFDRPDKSSGVGYQMTQKLRALGCPMMLPDKSIVHHGDHESVMHAEHRKITKLISK